MSDPADPSTVEDERGGPDSDLGEIQEDEQLPEKLPVLPLRNTTLFPVLITPMLATTPRARQLVEEAMLADRLLVTVSSRDEEVDQPEPQDLYEVGTAVRILRMAKGRNDSLRLWVQGLRRVRILDFTQADPYLCASIQVLDETTERGLEMEALQRNVSQQFTELTEDSSTVPEPIRAIVAGMTDPSALADIVAAHLGLSVPDRQELLEILDVRERLERLSVHLAREREVGRLEAEIREEVQEELSRSQREYVLREQARAIRRQLGEFEGTEEQVTQLRERLNEAGVPEEVYEHAERELNRLASMPPGAVEAGTVRNYLEWIVELPWSSENQDEIEISVARAILDEDHFDLEKVKERILEFLAVLKLKRDLRGPILCLAGPPGTGKTSLGRSIARATGREFARISLGGVRDEAEIRGHRRTYIGALPGRIIQTLRRAGTRNPVILLDEIDKLGTDFRGDPASALLEVLDAEQNHAFSDHYLEVPFDLSKVLFVATANLLDRVPPALRDRLEVIELPGYTEEDKLEIGRRFLVPRQLEACGLAEDAPRFEDAALEQIIRGYTREAGLRNLERELGKVARKLARRRVEEGSVPALIRASDLHALLGPVRFQPEVAGRLEIPGVAVGLAVTEAGGEILFVEATRMPGKGRIKLTGSLGDVMRESAQTAVAVVRSRAREIGLDPEQFPTSDLHIHVPAGATPKDGPSAGVAMIIALVSLLTDTQVPPDLAVTGEITLRGVLLPVGGIKEKVLAARRAGVTRVLLPARNEKDLAEIPGHLLDGLKLELIETTDQALRVVFGTEILKT
ncbi:MAG: endopeptidase La [Myxococcales bacterium]|nr:endopeptidase La [Myxococcales bacterium]